MSVTIELEPSVVQKIRKLAGQEGVPVEDYVAGLVGKAASAAEEKRYSILELEGMGAELWKGIDAQEYVNQIRDEWDR